MGKWCHFMKLRLFVYIVTIRFQLFGVYSEEVFDNRCQLANGSSRQNLVIPEDTPVGSIIGEINVIGNPSPGGNIYVYVEDPKKFISIIPGTKNLTLLKQLDKEDIEGPSSVSVNIICEKLKTLNSEVVIPLTITVTDINDNYPIFVKAPYKLNISEVTVVGTRVLRGVYAIDGDESLPYYTVVYSVLPGPYSDFFEFEKDMEGTLVLKKPLDYEKLKQFDVNIRASDTGESPKHTDTILTVNVLDADDQNPKFADEKYSAVVQPSTKVGSFLDILPRPIKAYDQDTGINASIHYDFTGDNSHFDIDKYNARVRVKKMLENGRPSFPKTLVVKATQNDNPDRYALTTLTVTGSPFKDKVTFLERNFHIVVPESTPRCVILGVLATNRPGQNLKYYVSNKDILETFAINPKGEVALKKQLDYETTPEYFFRVFATDGITNDSSSVNISVKDENEWEPRFRFPRYEFFATDELSDLIGKIEVKDGDKNDQLTLKLTGQNASNFYITPEGELRSKVPVADLKGTAVFTVVAKDNAKPPHVASVPVVVYFQPRNDTELLEEKDDLKSSTLLVGLGMLLLFLALVIFLLIFYIMKSKRRSAQEGLLPSVQSHTSNRSNIKTGMLNEFEEIPKSRVSRSADDRRKPSPKVHPAPQPPLWSTKNPVASLNKKINWQDSKDDPQNTESSLRSQKLPDNMNLTVYF